MTTVWKQSRIALLGACVLAACVSRSGISAEKRNGAPITPSFILQNMSQDRIAVYLVEGTDETLLCTIAPLRMERVSLPDRVFTSRSTTATLAIAKHGTNGTRLSQVDGAVAIVPIRSASLNGQTLSFSGDYFSGLSLAQTRSSAARLAGSAPACTRARYGPR